MAYCILNLFEMCLNLTLAKRLHLSHRVFWKAARYLTGKISPHLYLKKNFFVVPKRFKLEKQVFMQEGGYDSSLMSKDKDHKNLPVSPFLPGANSRVNH